MTTDRVTVGSAAVGVAAALAFALTLAVFWPSVENGFISDWDDSSYVTDNPRVVAGLTGEGLRWALVASHSGNWHPTTWLSHMLDSELYGVDPRGHHRTSVILHALNASLLLIALALAFAQPRSAPRRLHLDDLWKIGLVVGVFALHPLRVESVAWVSERKDVLSAFFFFAMLAGYSLHARRPSHRLFYLAVALPLALGLMAKPMLVSAPFLLLLFDYWPLRRVAVSAGRGQDESSAGEVLSLRALVIEKVPLVLIVVASVVATFTAQRLAGAVPDLGHVSLDARIANSFIGYATYLVQLVWPVGLAAFYPHLGDVHPMSEVWKMALVPMLAFAIVNAAALALWRRAPYLAVGFGWYAVAILPVIGLVQVGAQGWADRYTYLPLLGPTWALVWGAHALAARFISRPNGATSALVVVGVASCIALVPVTRAQIRTWQSRESVWTRALDAVPRNYRAAQKLGALRYEQERYAEAVEALERADAIVPNWAPTQHLLGIAYRATGQSAKSAQSLDRALAAGASATAIRAEKAKAALDQKDYRAAIGEYEVLVGINPRDPASHFNLGKALAGTGKIDQALIHFQKASELLPEDDQLRLIVAEALERTDRGSEAIPVYRAVLERQPGNPRVIQALERLGAQ